MLFIFLSFSFVFALLHNGLYIERITLPYIQAKQLYIKWDEKLEFSLERLLIKLPQNEQDDAFDYKKYVQTSKIVLHTLEWFHSITIEQLLIGESNITFHYDENAQGFLKIDSPSFNLEGSLENTQTLIKLTIETLKTSKKNITLTGVVYADLESERLYSLLHTSVNDDLKSDLFMQVDAKSIDFSAQSKKVITDPKALVKMAGLSEDIKFWTYDAIEVDSLALEELWGHIDFNNLADLYKNIYVKAKANRLNYTYNRALDAIHTAFTELEYKEGVLYIRPKDALSYTQALGESWLKIDFSTPQELLTLKLLFEGSLNKDMLHILDTYGIKLPFLQKDGVTKVDLTLAVNLITIDVEALGSFMIQNGNFDYLKLNLNIENAKIELKNQFVTTNTMQIQYKDIASSDVQVTYDAGKSEGWIDFSLKDISFKGWKLDNNATALAARYFISPKQDSLKLDRSHWSYKGYTIGLDPLEIPFDLESLKITLPTTLVWFDGIGSAFVSGDVDLENEKAALDVDLLTFAYNGIKVAQSDTPFHVKIDEKIEINAVENLPFEVAGTEFTLEKPDIIIDEEQLVLKNSKLTMGKYATTRIFAKHTFDAASTHVSLSDLLITDSHQFETLFKKKKVLLSIKEHNDTIEINSGELDASFFSNNHGWMLHVNSISQLVSNSEFLTKFNINTGDFTLYKDAQQKNVAFSSNIIYPYKILTQEGLPTENYKIEGEIKSDGVALNINEDTDIFIDKNVDIRMKNVGLNVHEIINAVSEFESDEDEASDFKLSLVALDSFIYLSEKRRALSEIINLQYENKILTAQLSHEQGKAGMRLFEKQFHLYGRDFNDVFMQELFSPSKFKGGSFDFSVEGKTKEYGGVLYMKETTVLDYKLLNNILAFINTVPSLVTFSLPGYSTNGLKVKEAYLNFKAKDGIYNLSDIFLESKELSILGKGEADFNKESIDVKLNLKTDLGSDASQIPLVGYILFDKESVSTGLNLKGDLNDPKIETRLVRDMAVAPINIIKRTLSLPYNLWNTITPEEKKSSETNSSF